MFSEVTVGTFHAMPRLQEGGGNRNHVISPFFRIWKNNRESVVYERSVILGHILFETGGGNTLNFLSYNGRPVTTRPRNQSPAFSIDKYRFSTLDIFQPARIRPTDPPWFHRLQNWQNPFSNYAFQCPACLVHHQVIF